MQTVLKKQKPTVILWVLIALYLVLLLLRPDRYTQRTLDGVILWATCVVPTIFPFLFCTTLLRASNVFSVFARKIGRVSQKILGMGGEFATVLLVGMASGYPVGAKLLADLAAQNPANANAAQWFAAICSTAGPIFVISSVGAGMFLDPAFGVAVLICHWSAVLAYGIFKNALTKKNRLSAPPVRQAAPSFNLAEGMASAVLSILCVGGFIAIFSGISAMTDDLRLLYPLESAFTALNRNRELSRAFSASLIELTNGCRLLSAFAKHDALPYVACSVTFGGASILAQQFGFLSQAGVRFFPFLAEKALQSALAFLFGFLLQFAIF